MGGRLPYSTGVACSLVASVGAGVGCSADGVMGGKGVCCCLPDARAVLYGGIRAASHVRDVRGVRYVLLAPRAPLACWGWDCSGSLGFGRRMLRGTVMFPIGLGHELWHRGGMLNKNIQNDAHLQQFLSGWRAL